MSFEEAAGISAIGVTAYVFLHTITHVQPGQKVFISGGGTGCGWMLIQLAKAAGAHVTASCSAARFEQLKSLGADVVRFHDTVASSLLFNTSPKALRL
jgi:alcohol dehydrogenase